MRSMSKRGCSPNNNACKSFFGLLKVEPFHGGSEARGASKISWMQIIATSIGAMSGGLRNRLEG